MVNEIPQVSDISVFPNPAIDKIIIESPQQAFVEISNIQGKIIKTIEANEYNTSIDISSFAKGMYFVKLKIAKGLVVKKFVKE